MPFMILQKCLCSAVARRTSALSPTYLKPSAAGIFVLIELGRIDVTPDVRVACRGCRYARSSAYVAARVRSRPSRDHSSCVSPRRHQRVWFVRARGMAVRSTGHDERFPEHARRACTPPVQPGMYLGVVREHRPPVPAHYPRHPLLLAPKSPTSSRSADAARARGFRCTVLATCAAPPSGRSRRGDHGAPT